MSRLFCSRSMPFLHWHTTAVTLCVVFVALTSAFSADSQINSQSTGVTATSNSQFGKIGARIMFDPPNKDWIIPICGKPRHGIKRIGWGKYGIQFPIPIREMKIKGGKWDVDYVVYVIQPNESSSSMQIWFGINDYEPDPDHDLLVASAELFKRDMRTNSTNNSLFGVDNWGQLEEGEYWRHTSIGQGGAKYRDATREDAAIFDRIINSMCFVPYRRR